MPCPLVQPVIPRMLNNGWKCLTMTLNEYIKNSEHSCFPGKYKDLKPLDLTSCLKNIFKKYCNHPFCWECLQKGDIYKIEETNQTCTGLKKNGTKQCTGNPN